MKKFLLGAAIALGLLPAVGNAAGTHPLNQNRIYQQDYGSCTLTNPCPVPTQAQVDANTAAITTAAQTAAAALPFASAGPLATVQANSAAAAIAAALGYTPANPAAVLPLSGGILTGPLTGTFFGASRTIADPGLGVIVPAFPYATMNLTATVPSATSGVSIVNATATTVTTSDPSAQGDTVNLDGLITIQAGGTGISNQAGHVVAVKGQANSLLAAGSTYDKLIGNEGECQQTGTGTLLKCYAYDAAMGGNNGTINEYDFYVANWGGNSGTIGNIYGLNFPNISGSGTAGTITGNIYVVYNPDPTAVIQTAGKIENLNGSEYTVAMTPDLVSGRQYFGIDGLANSYVIANLLTNINWGLLVVPKALTFTTIQYTVSTPQAGGLCQLAVYATRNGHPIGAAPIASTGDLSAETAGLVTASISASLPSGLYATGIQCNNNAIGVTSYQELAAHSVFGATTLAAADDNPITANGTYGSWPSYPLWTYITRTGAIDGILPRISLGF